MIYNSHEFLSCIVLDKVPNPRWLWIVYGAKGDCLILPLTTWISGVLGLQVYATTPGLCCVIDQTQGSVHAWQALYQLGCIPCLKTHNVESTDTSLKMQMIYLTVNRHCLALHLMGEFWTRKCLILRSRECQITVTTGINSRSKIIG